MVSLSLSPMIAWPRKALGHLRNFSTLLARFAYPWNVPARMTLQRPLVPYGWFLRLPLSTTYRNHGMDVPLISESPPPVVAASPRYVTRSTESPISPG